MNAIIVRSHSRVRGPKYSGHHGRAVMHKRPHARRGHTGPVYWDYEGRPYWRYRGVVSTSYHYRFAEPPLEKTWGEAPLGPARSFVEVRRGPRVIYGTEIQPPPPRIRLIYGEGPFQPGPAVHEAMR